MRKRDVFISYAVEDKHPVASAITTGLKQRGLKVYFVSDELASGGSVLETVYKGLENSKYCIVILSEHYRRTWPAIERSMILRREQKLNKRLIFPVRHEISQVRMNELFPELHDHYTESTEEGLEVVIGNLYASILKRKREDQFSRWKKVLAFVCFLIPAMVVAWQNFTPGPEPEPLPGRSVIGSLIGERITTFEKYAEHRLVQAQVNPIKMQASLKSIQRFYNTCDSLGEYERNNYTFDNGVAEITGRSNIEQEVFSVPDSPHTAYGINAPQMWLLEKVRNDTLQKLSVAFVDTAQVTFRIDSVFRIAKDVHVWISYQHYIRSVFYTLSYSASDQTRRQSVEILSFKPREEYIISNAAGVWKIQEVK